MKRRILLRAVGCGLLTYSLLKYTVDGHIDIYDIIPAAILAGLAINEYFLRKGKHAPRSEAP